jgi:PTS system mannose-specific IIB component
MTLLLTRIDNRLIHGQVLEAWVPYINANCIVVASDEVARATFQRSLMEAAVPRGIRLVIGTLEEVAHLLAGSELADRRVLLLLANSAAALDLYRLGVHFPELNLGNMHAGDGKLRLCCTIALDPEDVGNLQSLDEAGVRITSQCIPSDRGQGWQKLIRKLKE